MTRPGKKTAAILTTISVLILVFCVKAHAYEEYETLYERLFERRHDMWERRIRDLRIFEREAATATVSDRKEEKEVKTFKPDDPYYSYQWGLAAINAEKAWDISTGEGVVVAVLDTGIDYNHVDLRSQLYYNTGEIPGDGIDNDRNGYVDDYLGWDFAGTAWYSSRQDNDVIDLNGHGTHVAGIIAAEGGNAEGIVGVAPEAKILPVKVLDDSGCGSWTSVARGIKYAADMGAKVINLSLGGWGQASPLSYIAQMVRYAVGKGCVIVAAAGNSSADAKNFLPANMPDVIAVAATQNLKDVRAHFSNYGSCIDVAAPGVNVLSLRAAGTGLDRSYSFEPKRDAAAEYRWLHGTSMAAPFVSGLAALLLAAEPDLTPEEVRGRIRNSATDAGSPGFDIYTGYGRIDAYAALTYEDADSEDGAGAIKGENAEEVLLKNEVEMKNRSEFTGYGIKEDVNADRMVTAR